MAKTVEMHGVTFIHRKPAKPGVYLYVTVNPYTDEIISRIDVVNLGYEWTFVSGRTVISAERWLTRTGLIMKSAGYYFTEKTIGEMNA